jgi:hypothetical protein
MAVVNPTIRAPLSPGEWVDEEECYQCGEQYHDFRCYPNFIDCADRLRYAAFSKGDEGGGYRSRGPVLWVMRTEKLQQWYMKHLGCGYEWEQGEAQAEDESAIAISA